MKKIIVLLLLLVAGRVFADEAALQFEQANQLYRGGEYQKAVSMYEQIISNGYGNAEVYFNLGNSYFKLKNIPSAILNYERAKRIAPHDEDISYNLRLANIRIVDKIDPLPTLFLIEWWRAFLNLNSADVWALISIVALWCLMLSAAAFLLVRSFLIRRLMTVIGFLAFIIGIISFVGVVQRNQIELSDREAIVFSQSISVKSAPDAQSVDLFVIHEGVKTEILDIVGNWRKIRLADGKIGWISSESLQII